MVVNLPDIEVIDRRVIIEQTNGLDCGFGFAPSAQQMTRRIIGFTVVREEQLAWNLFRRC